MIAELKAHTKESIYSFPLPDDQGDWTTLLNKLVSMFFFFEVLLKVFFLLLFLEWLHLT